MSHRSFHDPAVTSVSQSWCAISAVDPEPVGDLLRHLDVEPLPLLGLRVVPGLRLVLLVRRDPDRRPPAWIRPTECPRRPPSTRRVPGAERDGSSPQATATSREHGARSPRSDPEPPHGVPPLFDVNVSTRSLSAADPRSNRECEQRGPARRSDRAAPRSTLARRGQIRADEGPRARPCIPSVGARRSRRGMPSAVTPGQAPREPGARQAGPPASYPSAAKGPGSSPVSAVKSWANATGHAGRSSPSSPGRRHRHTPDVSESRGQRRIEIALRPRWLAQHQSVAAPPRSVEGRPDADAAPGARPGPHDQSVTRAAGSRPAATSRSALAAEASARTTSVAVADDAALAAREPLGRLDERPSVRARAGRAEHESTPGSAGRTAPTQVRQR